METIDDVSLRSLRVLDAVAREGGFAAAGRDLGLTRAAVSRIAVALEAQVGTRLFRRTTRQVVLTEAAHQLAGQLRDSLPAMRAALALAAEAEHALAGLVRISVSHAFGRRYVVPSIARFLNAQRAAARAAHATQLAAPAGRARGGRAAPPAPRRSPSPSSASTSVAPRRPAAPPAGIQIDLRLEDRFEDLVGQPIDLAVRMGPLESGLLIARRLGRIETVLVAAPRLWSARAEPSPDELARLPAVNFRLPGTQEILPWTVEVARQRCTISPVEVVASTDAIEAVIDLARAGCGAAFVPRYLVEAELDRGALRALAPGVSEVSPLVHLCYLGRHQMPARVRTVLAHLERELAAALGGPSRQGRASR